MNDLELSVVEMCVESLRKGCLPIGSIVVDEMGKIISRGRNMINEDSGRHREIYGNAIAHAELNALAKLDGEHINKYTIYCSMEPCVMCAGAIYMSGIRNIVYGMKDYLAGGLNLYGSTEYYSRKKMKIQHNQDLQIVQAVLIGFLEDKEYIHRGGFWEMYLKYYEKEYLTARKLLLEGIFTLLVNSIIDVNEFIEVVHKNYC
ncbi:nucleoside deaminase [Thermotoga profunda]|uniref:nucleoside deaminase n=1 Tax=Thermotoga profunda TaxID=1508420 RepID=UPI000693561D|nr:nucleoside deaminase [Thermotoga profunda]